MDFVQKAEAVTRARIVERAPETLAARRVHIERPSESCTSGRQSTAVGFFVSENQYIDVRGAMPKRAMSRAQVEQLIDVHDDALAARASRIGRRRQWRALRAAA